MPLEFELTRKPSKLAAVVPLAAVAMLVAVISWCPLPAAAQGSYPPPQPGSYSIPESNAYSRPEAGHQSTSGSATYPRAEAAGYSPADQGAYPPPRNPSATRGSDPASLSRPQGIPIQLVQRETPSAATRDTLAGGGGSHSAARTEPADPRNGDSDPPAANERALAAETGAASTPLDQNGLAPIPLTPIASGGPTAAVGRRSGTAGAMVTVAASLTVVLGAFFLVLWLTRRAFPRSGQGLPSEVFELLGQSVLGARQTMQLVRVGNRLLVLAVSPSDVRTLSEITDADEVRQLAASCRRAHPESVSAAFRQVLGQFHQDASHSRGNRAAYAVSTATARRGRTTAEA